jgi:rRNA-processing protein FCF1
MGQGSSVNERKRVQVLLDTSALLLFYEGINVFDELERTLETNLSFITLDAVINELKKLSKKGL